jgi:hypothetical protein
MKSSGNAAHHFNPLRKLFSIWLDFTNLSLNWK